MFEVDFSLRRQKGLASPGTGQACASAPLCLPLQVRPLPPQRPALLCVRSLVRTHLRRSQSHIARQAQCYDPEPYPQFSAIFHHFILRSWSLVPHSFPHAPLGPPPNHLTSHLIDHLTIPQSTITCHHSAVRSIPQYHHLPSSGLPAHCHVMIDRQLMMELYLDCQLIASS